MEREAMLTTLDNPYNPFTDWDNWLAFDEEKGYNTCGYLARIANTSDALSDADNQVEIENAMNEIIELNVTGNYKKIYKDN